MTNNENLAKVLSSVLDDNPITSRFSSAPWFENVKTYCDVTLAGVGGIGSYVAFLLSRLDVRSITMYDVDIVEISNLSGQLYCNGDIRRPKVNAIASFMNSYSNYYRVTCLNQDFTEKSAITSNIMICGFDNMKSRKIFYEKWKDRVSEEHKLFIDGRLAAEEFQVFCIQGDDEDSMKKYEEEWLFSDEEADTTNCSYKQTSFMAAMIGSVITNLLVNFCTNLSNPIFLREIPFITSYRADIMRFTLDI